MMATDSVDPKKDESNLLLQNGSANIPGAVKKRTTAQPEDENNGEVERLRISTAAETETGVHGVSKELLCGIGSCRPSWLQTFASKKSYVVVFGLLGAVQLTVATYFVSTISTLEKRFKIPSRTSGLISCAWDTGGLCSTLLLTYFGNRGHKTRWVAVGFFVASITCFARFLPHVIFGPGQDALELTLEYGSISNVSKLSSAPGNSGRAYLCNSQFDDPEDCSFSSTSTIPAAILFLAHVLLGMGTSTYYTLGIAYMDDNSRKNKTPFLLAVWQCIRMLGPTFGFLLGSYVLQFYVDPSLHPIITRDDPRWIGAWWLGWIPLGIIMAVLAFVLALFPKKLPRAARREQQKQQPPPNTAKSFSDFVKVMRRLLSNKVHVYNSLSTVCYMCGVTAYWTFMPKYMETQYRTSASSSSLITGSTGLIFSALGILSSGAVISWFKPGPRSLAAWNVLVEFFDAVGHFSFSFLNCVVDDLHGKPGPDNYWDLLASCNADCDCGPMVKYSPICSSSGNTTFYSPCHAGCTTVDVINGTKIFGNCSCIGDGSGWARDGACPFDCSTNFTIFITLLCTMRFFSASGRAGNAIIHFRCVNQDDKSMAIGFMNTLVCVLAFIPGPVLYGMLLDSACIVWGQTCGQSGNCWLYDGQRMSYLLNGTASAFLLLGTILDIGVWYHVKGISIYDEKDLEKDKKKRISLTLNTS